jgi:hypothetical protein
MFLTNNILILKNIINSFLNIIIGFLENRNIKVAFLIKKDIQVCFINSIYKISNLLIP